MFTELYAVARHTPLQISVSPDGPRLNVLIIPKPGDDAAEGSALTKPIQAIGTPEELDRELPARLAEYCAAINDLRLKIDMPIEAITAEAGKGGAKKKANMPASRKPARAAAPRPKKQAKKKAAPKPVKPARKAVAVKPARRVKAISPAHAKQIHAAHAPPAAAAPASQLDLALKPEKSKRATREECLADLRTYLAECESTSVTITRALFLGHNTTGRSYERKFKSWEEFLAEGKKTPGDAAPPDPVASSQSAVASDADAETPDAGDDVQPAATTISSTTINPAEKWPFPETQPAAQPIHRAIYTNHGDLLGAIATPLARGAEYAHPQLGVFLVTEIIVRDDGSERITVEHA